MYRAFWIRKAVTGAIDHLLDGKEGDEHAADRDRYIERRHRSHRRHAQALKAVEIIQVTEIDHAKRDRERHAAIEQFEEQPLSAAQRFRKHSKIEMIVARVAAATPAKMP